MDFLDPAKKRTRTMRLFISYILIGVMVVLASTILMVLAFNYGIDRSQGKITIIQRGLVFVSSYPTSAEVYVNGEKRGNTNLRLNIPAGQYTFELKRSGYRDWKRTVDVDGGRITSLTYPFLFPNTLTPSDTQLYKTPPKLVSQSFDNNWLIVQSTDKFNTFDRYNLGPKTPTKQTITLPDSTYNTAAGAHSLTAVEWASDNRHVLLKHNFKGGSEFIAFDIQEPTKSINLNKQFSFNPTLVTLRDKKFDQYYLYAAKGQLLTIANANAKTVQPLIKGVIAYKSLGSKVVAFSTTTDAPAGKTAVKIWDGSKNYLVDNFNSKSDIKVDMASYRGSDYLTVSLGATGQTYIYKNPLQKAKANQRIVLLTAIKLSKNSFTSFSKNSRFIESQYGKDFGVYDLEETKLYYFKVPYELPAVLKAEWMDGNRLTTVYKSSVLVFDFDGTNIQKLTTSLDGYKAYFDKDFVSMFNIAPSTKTPGQYALTKAELKLSNR